MTSGQLQTIWDYDPDLHPATEDPVSGKVRKGLDLGIFVELAGHLGRLVDNMEADQKRRDRIDNTIPGDPALSAAGVYPTSGNLVLNLGSPDIGTFWEVRHIIIGGSDITTAPAGVGWLFVTGSQPGYAGANPPLSQARDFTTGTFPQKAFYGTHEMVVNESEYLYVIITSGTIGTQYAVAAKIETINMGLRARQSFIE